LAVVIGRPFLRFANWFPALVLDLINMAVVRL